MLAVAASLFLTLLIVLGSRLLLHFDRASFDYAIARVVAFGAIVFRYATWLQRPATRAYFRRGLQLFRDRKKLGANTKSAATTIAANLIEQRFIFKRGSMRWLMHFLIMCGCLLAAAITFPLVFGWIYFELVGEMSYSFIVSGLLR